MNWLRFVCLSVVVSCYLTASTLILSAAEERPNVIMILSDDQGSIDANCYGATDLETPALDKLAREGVRFTQFYAAAPVCSPSRAGFLTGRVPQRAGVPGNVSSSQGHAGMPSEQITIAEKFQQAGYRTAHIGKWHLGYTPETMPNNQGFDLSFGHMGGCIDNWSHFFYWNGPNRHDLWKNGEPIWRDGEFFPDLMVRETREFLATQPENKPFFMYWAINVPHYPLQALDKWRQKYKHLKHPRDKYAAFVSTMDEKIGELLNHLEETGKRDNTIIVFQSDHGHSTEVRTFGGGGNSGPYRGAKFSLYEGGIRVPAIISWPEKLPTGEVREQLVTGCDWYPTLLDLCQIQPASHSLDGKNIAEVFRSDQAETPHKEFHWQSRDQWVVRQGKWKLLAKPIDTSGSNQRPKNEKRPERLLIDLSTDLGETTNLAEKFPQVVERLEKLHESWSKNLP